MKDENTIMFTGTESDVVLLGKRHQKDTLLEGKWIFNSNNFFTLWEFNGDLLKLEILDSQYTIEGEYVAAENIFYFNMFELRSLKKESLFSIFGDREVMVAGFFKRNIYEFRDNNTIMLLRRDGSEIMRGVRLDYGMVKFQGEYEISGSELVVSIQGQLLVFDIIGDSILRSDTMGGIGGISVFVKE
jgi:hypothetical protein